MADLLLVEDEPGDAYLTQEALRGDDQAAPVRVHVVEDGVEAMAFLRREGEYVGAPRPDLVLLDLNLPRMDGRQVLAAIKSDPELCTIPVVVLTTSSAQADIARCYELRANCFVTKPVDLRLFLEAVRTTHDFWLKVAQLPTTEAAR